MVKINYMKDIKIKTLIYNGLKSISIALPYALLIFIIIQLGFVPQMIIDSLLISNESNFYDSLYGGLIAIYDIEYFLEQATLICNCFLMASNILIILFINNKNTKKAFFYSSIFIFIVLVIYDYCNFYFVIKNENYSFATSIIFNLIGAPLISIILLLSLDFGEQISKFFETKKLLYHKIIVSIVIIFIGLMYILVVYIIYKNFLITTESKIDITIKPPINGEYNISKENKGKYNKSNIFGANSLSNDNNITLRGLFKNFSINSSISKTENFNAEIRVLNGCFVSNEHKINDLLLKPPNYSFKKISKINLSTKAIFLDFKTICKEKGLNGKIVFPEVCKKTINIESSKNKLLDLSIDLVNRKIYDFKHSYWMGEVSYLVTFPCMNFDNNTSLNTFIYIQTDKNNTKINLIPNKNLLNNDKPYCETFGKTSVEDYNLSAMDGGIILTIKKADKKDNKLFDILNHKVNNNTIIKGMQSGTFYINNTKSENMDSLITEGQLNNLNIVAGIQEIYVNGKKYCNVKIPSNHITILDSKLSGSVLKNGMLNFRGIAKIMYINEERVNFTRWEKIDSNYQLAIITGLLSFIVWAILYCYRRLKYIFELNEKISL